MSPIPSPDRANHGFPGGPPATSSANWSNLMNDTWTNAPADDAEEEASRALQTALDRRAD